MNALKETHFSLPGQQAFYRGKVRDVYTMNDGRLVMVASDRISAFDVVLPKGIPGKGAVLNQVAEHMLDATADLVPNWKHGCPAPNVMVGLACNTYRVEMVIRGYLTGHAWRVYREGGRVLCGVTMPDGLKEHDKFPNPIITPSTKADEGHDEDISREEIIEQGLVSEAEYLQLEDYTRALFQRGTELAAERGLILVDTKYEFGEKDGKIYLIDEIHTPDSSRYFYADGYQARQDSGEQQRQLSKEFVREWLMENGFMGKEGQAIPEMGAEFIATVTKRYIELYETITGKTFDQAGAQLGEKEVQGKIETWLSANA